MKICEHNEKHTFIVDKCIASKVPSLALRSFELARARSVPVDLPSVHGLLQLVDDAEAKEVSAFHCSSLPSSAAPCTAFVTSPPVHRFLKTLEKVQMTLAE